MYAALWEAFRVEYSMSSGGPGSGLFKSTDGGETWKEITRNPGLPTGVVGKIGVAVSGADSNRVYAIVENENGGLFSSDDAGATWKLMNAGRNIRQRAFYYTHVTADPNVKDTVYVENVGTFRSIDGGKTMVNFAGGDSHDLWIDPDDSNHVHPRERRRRRDHVQRGLAAADVELARLCDRAVLSRRDDEARAVSRVRRAAGREHGVRAERHRASGGGRFGGGGSLRAAGARGTFYGAGGSEDGYIAPDPKDPDVFFAGGNNGSFLTRSTGGRASSAK